MSQDERNEEDETMPRNPCAQQSGPADDGVPIEGMIAAIRAKWADAVAVGSPKGIYIAASTNNSMGFIIAAYLPTEEQAWATIFASLTPEEKALAVVCPKHFVMPGEICNEDEELPAGGVKRYPLPPCRERVEIAALLEMSDGDIDTSDIPELPAETWATGERGKFYKPKPGLLVEELHVDPRSVDMLARHPAVPLIADALAEFITEWGDRKAMLRMNHPKVGWITVLIEADGPAKADNISGDTAMPPEASGASTGPVKLETPVFANEAEEAAWWASDEGQAQLLTAFDTAEKDGTLGRGRVAREARQRKASEGERTAFAG